MGAFNLPPGCTLSDLEPHRQTCEGCEELRQIVTFDPPFLCEECETAQTSDESEQEKPKREKDSFSS